MEKNYPRSHTNLAHGFGAAGSIRGRNPRYGREKPSLPPPPRSNRASPHSGFAHASGAAATLLLFLLQVLTTVVGAGEVLEEEEGWEG